MAVNPSLPPGTDMAAIQESVSPPPVPVGPRASPTTSRSRSPGRIRIRTTDPEPIPVWREILTPASVRGWGVSVMVHLLSLLVLALIILKPPPKPPNIIDTRLAGVEQGSELGEQLRGGLGIDLPLAMPEALVRSPESSPTLTTTTLTSVSPVISSNSSSNSNRSGGRDGVALTGTGQGDGFGVAKFGHGGERINNVEVQVGDPQFTLIWSSRADLDLHVIEPGGSHLYWEHREGARGGKLDVDDVDGFGPENIFWGERIGQANGPPGEYQWFIHYYGAIGGVSVPTRWKMRLKHNGQAQIFEGKLARIGQRSRIYSFTVGDGTEGGTPDGGSVAATDEVKPLSAAELTDRRTKLFATPESMVPERDARGWVVVEPPDAGFRAAMPEPPTVERLAARSPRLGDLDLHVFTVDRGLGGYIITYADLPPKALKDGPDAVLDAEVRAAIPELASGGVTQLDERPITSGGHPGRAFSFDVPDRVVAGGGSSRVRVFLVGQRLYTTSVVGQKDFVAKPETDRFLDGFQILESQ